MRIALALILAAGPAVAQAPATFSLPAGCTAFVTVQNQSCEVEHHFTCTGDATGMKRRVSLDEQGLTYAGQIDAEAQWIASFHPMAGISETLVPDPADPASLTELFATNRDTWDFRTLSAEVGETRYVGQDSLTGRQVTIDGVTLEETAYEITAFDASGAEIWSSRGNEFVSRDWRMFLSGTSTVTTAGGTVTSDSSPVEFISPGEPGFLSASPKHGCGLAISSADILKENANDHL
ncbi:MULTISPECIES: hypothetical protein [unclassified Yoonia]|uniref:hypothetical protein n=1 Tax=unclassified Yoonia TaxID=2629118 RepID=UPI002AFF5400|nr:MULTISPECIES: hypothetical protein [unclassified Yoonia]